MFGPTIKKVQRGATSKSVLIRFVNQISSVPQTSISEATAGLVLRFLRLGATSDAVSIAPVSLGNLSSSYNSGGLKHIADGYYRLDVPDAAFADGGNAVDQVLITGGATGVVSSGVLVDLTSYDPFTNTPKPTREVY